MKKNKDIEKLYKKLILFNEINSDGFRFLKITRAKQFTKNLSMNKIPLSWKKIYFKSYPRLTQIKLKRVSHNKNKLFSIIEKRKSERKFKNKNLNLETISKILYFSCGIRNLNRSVKNFNKSLRMYPSAGARYPLEVYPVILKSNEIPLGIYHYNIKKNVLELLFTKNFKKKFCEITNQNWVKRSGMIIIITAVFPRTIVKYKERGWRYLFFEAGHLAQNIYFTTLISNLKCCTIGGFVDEEVSKLLDISSRSELPLYLIAVGK